MKVKFSPSVNIIRDSRKNLNYIATPNAEIVATTIAESFKRGIHAFTLIGSYGTGKSSFLWALQQSLEEHKALLPCKIVDDSSPVKYLNFVGVYQSLIEHFADALEVKNSLKGNQKIFDAIYQEYEGVKKKNGLLVIAIDEFGKFLEYAVKNDPDRELYFIQQLAEFVNDEERNILLITTLHQNFEAYSDKGLSESQRQEWKKVKGRLREVTFNEPIEQLLLLASKSLGIKRSQRSDVKSIIDLERKHHILKAEQEIIEELGDSLRPMDFFSSFVLAKALQRYGQNERSLFTFLELENLSTKKQYGLAEVYDYVYGEFYSYLTDRNNVDYTLWASIREAIDRAESKIGRSELAVTLIKIIGLLKLFGSPAARIDNHFLSQYSKLVGYSGDIKKTLDHLSELQIITFARYNQSYKTFEGTDVNIEEELRYAAKSVSDEVDIVKKLGSYFDFPYITAKAISYKKGTPRFFAFDINDELADLKPQGEIDGYISLLFNPKLNIEKVIKYSKETEEPILYGYFKNSNLIRDAILNIEKTGIVQKNTVGDKVVQRELNNILVAQRQILNHYVWDAFYSGDVSWIYRGKIIGIKSGRELNKKLSEICDKVYDKTPLFRNELINKHSLSGPIHNAKKLYFTALTKAYSEPDLGFPRDNFPPEKTIYITLLKETRIHALISSKEFDFVEDIPQRSPFNDLWAASEAFLDSCRGDQKPLSEFFKILSERPYKMKQGFLEFWIPTFLFIKRDDFALYGDQGYIPELNDSILYLFTRNAQEFYIKTFDVRGVKLNLYNRYREFLQLKKTKKISNHSFIESIRPFLVLYKNLPDYAKKTNRLSPETLAIRKAIENSQDPERVFFEDFPKALKTDLKKLTTSTSALENYIDNLQNGIRELRTCVDDLTNRIELFLNSEVLGNKKLKFPANKELLQTRYSKLKEHRLTPKQSAFLTRINAPMEDRGSWISSIVHTVSGRQLNALGDDDEEILKDRLMHLIHEMDNLSKLADQVHNDDEELIKVDVTTAEGLYENVIRVPKGKREDIKKLSTELRKLLGKDKRVNLASLSELLKELLKK